MNLWPFSLAFASLLLSCSSGIRCDCVNPACHDVIRLELKPEPNGYSLSDLDTLLIKSRLEGETTLQSEWIYTDLDSIYSNKACSEPWTLPLSMRKRSQQSGEFKKVEFYQLGIGPDSFLIDQMYFEMVNYKDECDCPHYSLQYFRLDGTPLSIASNFGFIKLKKKQ